MTAVLWVTEQGDSALALYRAELPGRGLASRYGYTVWHRRVLFESDDHRLRGWDGPGTGWTPVPRIVVCRHLKDVEGREIDSSVMFRDAAESGQHVFVDMDDNLWKLPAWNPAAMTFTGENLRAVELNCDAAAGVLVSTEPLAEEVRQHTDTPVWVCRNGIDAAAYPFPHVDHTPLRVAWLGLTDWRINDLAEIAEPLREALGGLSVEFWHLGHQTHRLHIEEAIGHDFPVPIKRDGWVRMSMLGELLSRIDVAVVPMVDIPLNESRSPTTGLALAATGIPFVASPTPAYLELSKAGAGLIAGTPDDWVRMLRTLIVDPDWRHLCSAKGRAAVLEHYRYDKVAADWHAAFSSVKNRRAPKRVSRPGNTPFRQTIA